ncbi:interferon gamma receptor 1 [Acanthopagrus latus]|uniref:interferon gamma receptor 1 n=1 Tax=Acanthopagrus latus TaxID=8177 RepID=UPI00187C07CD|nr:interferon gamma receptor 1 [Acanthopagrus latus]
MLLDGAFRAPLLPPHLPLLLLAVMSGASAVIVPPPTNLRVSCENLNVTASWEFSRQQPPTVFSVRVGCAAESHEIKTRDQQCDLTSFIWSSESSYMDNFYVTVTAEQGGNQSEPVQSKTFSFNTMKTVDVKCELDFPPVDLKWTDSGATVSFRNPFHVYSLKANNPSDAWFDLRASTNPSGGSSKTYSYKCTAREESCKLDVGFLGGVERCVALDGTLFDSIGVGQILFRKVERVCADEPAEDHLVVLLAVLLSLAAVVISLITVCVCVTKAWTMKTSEDLPRPLWSEPLRQDLRYNTVSDPNMVVVTPTGVLPLDECTEDLQDRGFWSDSEEGFSASSKREQEATALMYEGNRTDDDSADSSVKTECVSLHWDEVGEEEQQEEEEESDRPYDRPHNLPMDNVQVDIGDGEMVTAYLGR